MGSDKPCLILESQSPCDIKQIAKAQAPNFLAEVFTDYANKQAEAKIMMKEDWVSSALLLKEAGLGYFVSFVDYKSPRSVRVSFPRAGITEGGMVLKGRDGIEEEASFEFRQGYNIILAKVKWELEGHGREYKFPPQDIKVESELRAL